MQILKVNLTSKDIGRDSRQAILSHTKSRYVKVPLLPPPSSRWSSITTSSASILCPPLSRVGTPSRSPQERQICPSPLYNAADRVWLVQSQSALALPVVLFALAAASSAQYNANSPQNAAILSEQRYQTGDGTFGSSYSQEDGVEFKEESDVEGNRRGSYSYVDPSGQRRTVTYTAGKDGFRASGDHLPVAPAPVAPQPQYQPQPQYNPPQQQYNSPQQQYNPPQQQYNPPQQQYNPPQQQYNQYQQPQYNPTTQPPHRFYPPGKLNLNRTPDGYSYTFNKS
uniref:Uncharacterized protein n=1 Tax=Timema cristinae TaxID=61476 RepID=A0A7R9DIP0_TIMCR|nr:unnamed protein product [Timema cristinae]